MHAPVPVSFNVFVASAINVFGLVDHTTPRAVIIALPAGVILPPLVAELSVTSVIEVVVTLGKVMNVLSSPYPVPELFVAYACSY